MADESVLNMSLDDIIQQKSTKVSGGKKKATSKRDKDDRTGGKLRVTVGGSGIGKNRQGRGRNIQNGQATRTRPVYDALPSQPRNPEAVNGDAAWEHDLFDEGQPQARRVRPAVNGFKILIKNLDYKVSDEDVQELFENCGTILKAGVIYDRSGRSEEAAEVIFESRQDALTAVKQYNNLALDNKPMKIELVEGTGSGGERMLSSGLRLGAQNGRGRAAAVPDRPQRGRQTGRQVRAPRDRRDQRPNGNARGRGAAISMTDLDKDLDSYMATE